MTIAIVGMACEYPDARSPQELWQNVLAQRRAFRQIPHERLNSTDYISADRNESDLTYANQAAVIEGYEFDRVKFRVAGSTFRSADLSHWLALDIADRALADAGFTDGDELPKESTGVLLGNTLTGEFSRANTLRLRWPYVRRVVDAKLVKQGWTADERHQFLQELESQYKEPFAPVGDETLAGNLSNTIAGRICNYFDLKGGGYTLDGACSSSLLAVANACSALVAGDLDVALAGGVDLSLDPLELVGFAKVGALATDEMRIYDAQSAGFLPGEGCGFVVLMRYEDAIAQHRRIYATIRGWGISSDGSGGISRPEVEGQLLALKRAYGRAGFGIDTVGYFEGHGTGTTVGDTTELRTLSQARREANAAAQPAAIGSIKGNIGHTKAAAGIAGLIKATMAIHQQILPPTTGCQKPHSELTGEKPALQVLSQGQPWSESYLRAGVSAMGFGGINSHIVLEATVPGPVKHRRVRNPQLQGQLASSQDAELLLISAKDPHWLKEKVNHLLTIAPKLSLAEIADLAAELARTLDSHTSVRAAIVASTAKELTSGLETLKSWLETGETNRLDMANGLFLGIGRQSPRIGFLFPGQASPVYFQGGIWARRFPWVRDFYQQAALPTGDPKSTAVAQPAIVTGSSLGLQVLAELGIHGSVGVGHSLGELSALHWGGAIAETTLLDIAKVRGKAMAELGDPTGMMASIRADEQTVKSLLNGKMVRIAGLNSPHQTIISGETTGINQFLDRARQKGIDTVILPVSHAFHSPLVAAAAQPLGEYLAQVELQPLQGRVISTVTGSPLNPEVDLSWLLCRQITDPVRFMDAITQAVEGVDLFLEVGPGQILTRLIKDFIHVPTVALDAGGSSLKGLLQAVGATFALGGHLNHQALFAGRFTRPFNLNWQPKFFVNPCELAPISTLEVEATKATANKQPTVNNHQLPTTNHQPATSNQQPANNKQQPATDNQSPLDCFRELVAQRAELPPEAVKEESRLLSDLHLNSITVSQLVADAARSLGLAAPVAPTDYADATVGEVAQSLEELVTTGGPTSDAEEKRSPAGVDAWIRTFTVELVETPLAKSTQTLKKGTWQVIAPADYPLTVPLQKAFGDCPGAGVVVCLPANPDEHDYEQTIQFLLEATQAVLTEQQPAKQTLKQTLKFILVQHGGGGASFARTLHLEAPNISTCVVDVPIDHPQAIEWVLAEAQAAGIGYGEAHYDATGLRRSPVLQLLPQVPEGDRQDTSPTLGSDDVLLVTGGGKGIAAECALSVAKETGVRLALLGRSNPETDAELASNIERMKAAGLQVCYVAADVTDAAAVGDAVSQIEAEFGTVTAIIHGAGVNKPKLISSLDNTDFLSTLAPKVQGVRNVLAAVNPEQLRLFVTFGSIIARTGLAGEAHYALANEWLGRLVERFQMDHPTCHCLNLEWSVWSGVGMGDRLGRIDALMQQGITPIPPDIGINILHRLIMEPLPVTSVVATGRFGEPPTLKVEQPELPFWRFLEQSRVYYPGVELVVDAELATHSDPYLNDHIFQKEQIFPGVMGLEAMSQVVMALWGTNQPPIFEDVSFTRPVVVPDHEPLKIRIAALLEPSGQVKVVLRSQQTAFAVDHFQATCTMGNGDSHLCPVSLQPSILNPQDFQVSLNPEQDLYGNILFHRGRFQRLHRYRHLQATECVAEIAPASVTQWFGRYLPAELVLGDPGARDAVIHALQACIPHATLLPVAVERLVLNRIHTNGTRFICAKERSHQNDTFIYDIEVIGEHNEVLERWEGLQLKVLQPIKIEQAWVESLLGPYVERRIAEFIPTTDVTVVVDSDATVERRVKSDRAIKQAINTPVTINRRLDGKPEVIGSRAVSAAHADHLTLAVASSSAPVGCDIEPVVERSAQTWQDLLGKERYQLTEILVHETSEDPNIAATRVWTAAECLKKAGSVFNQPLTLTCTSVDGWVIFQAGSVSIPTFVVSVQEMSTPVVLAVLVNNGQQPVTCVRSFAQRSVPTVARDSSPQELLV